MLLITGEKRPNLYSYPISKYPYIGIQSLMEVQQVSQITYNVCASDNYIARRVDRGGRSTVVIVWEATGGINAV